MHASKIKKLGVKNLLSCTYKITSLSNFRCISILTYHDVWTGMTGKFYLSFDLLIKSTFKFSARVTCLERPVLC